MPKIPRPYQIGTNITKQTEKQIHEMRQSGKLGKINEIIEAAVNMYYQTMQKRLQE